MAEGGGLKNDAELIGWVISWIFVLAILGAILSPLQNRTGTLSPGNLIARVVGGYAFSDATPLGSRVSTIRETLVWDRAGGASVKGILLGTQPAGVFGTLIGGPGKIDGDRWWDVDFDTGVDGWVAESDLALETTLATIARVLRVVSIVLSLLFLTGTVYSMLRINQIRKKEREALRVPDLDDITAQGVINTRWEHVLGLVSSENPNDWRAAVLEADIMLDELLTKQGYDGESIADKLKAIEISDFNSLNDAWEAHKVRNRIAHSGSDFILTNREARRVIGLFENVFSEFNFI